MQREPAEGPLVDEAQLGPRDVVEPDTDPQMLLVGHRLGLDQELPAHPEMAEHRVRGGGPGPGRPASGARARARRPVRGRVLQRQPEVLPPPACHPEPAPAQRGGEVVAARGVTAYGTGMQHLHIGDGTAGDPALQSAPYDFDLGQLGHAAPQGWFTGER